MGLSRCYNHCCCITSYLFSGGLPRGLGGEPCQGNLGPGGKAGQGARRLHPAVLRRSQLPVQSPQEGASPAVRRYQPTHTGDLCVCVLVRVCPSAIACVRDCGCLMSVSCGCVGLFVCVCVCVCARLCTIVRHVCPCGHPFFRLYPSSPPSASGLTPAILPFHPFTLSPLYLPLPPFQSRCHKYKHEQEHKQT